MDTDRSQALTALFQNPYPLYAAGRAERGLTYVPFLDAWLVSRYADVREVLRRPDVFSSANTLVPEVQPGPAAMAELAKGVVGGGPLIVTADGAAHRRYRVPVVRALSSGRVARVLAFIAETVATLVDSFADAGRAELMSQYADRLPAEVFGHVLGLDPADVPVAIQGARRAEQLMFQPLEDAEQAAAARDVVALQHLLDRYVCARHGQPREDLISELVRGLAPGTDALTLEQRQEQVWNLQNILLAGTVTTTALLGVTLLDLLRHRSQWEALCSAPDRIPAAVEEAARHDAPVQGFRRVTTCPATLAGTDLPAGAAVLAAFGSANRDETRYERPEEFQIDREPVPHLAFGHGVHACPGAELAREELRITLETFARRLPGLRLATDEPIAMLPTMIHRTPVALPVEW
jgi:cytochrome P450